MSQLMVLGIHSNVAGDTHDFTAGHAWLSITYQGKVTTYGLWPDKHPAVKDNGPASDVRTNMENNANATASRYYRLTAGQAMHFNAMMSSLHTWGYTNNCSSWASEVVKSLLGEDVDADDWGGLETPRELGKSIRALERKHPTSPYVPRSVSRNPDSSVFSGSKP